MCHTWARFPFMHTDACHPLASVIIGSYLRGLSWPHHAVMEVSWKYLRQPIQHSSGIARVNWWTSSTNKSYSWPKYFNKIPAHPSPASFLVIFSNRYMPTGLNHSLNINQSCQSPFLQTEEGKVHVQRTANTGQRHPLYYFYMRSTDYQHKQIPSNTAFR